MQLISEVNFGFFCLETLNKHQRHVALRKQKMARTEICIIVNGKLIMVA